MRLLSLGFVLAAFWLASSGRFDGILLTFLAVSLVLTSWLSVRCRVLDVEGHPTHLIPRALRFWAWLVVEVVRSNVTVLRLLVARRPAISPCLVRVPLSPHDDLGRTIVGNSITLTPGTLTVDVDDRGLLVHCLTEAIAADLARGEFDLRVRRVTGGGARS